MGMPMRIVKSYAINTLERENALLEAQKSRCQQQARKLEELSMAGLKGDAAESIGLRTRAQAVILSGHLAFYDSLANANRTNMRMIRALPETSPGVLDTAVATDRMMEAEGRLGSLDRAMGEAMSAAERTNHASEPFNRGSAGYNAPPVTVVDTNAIRQSYEAMMRTQQVAVNENKAIIAKADAYNSESLGVYQAVDAASLKKSMGTCDQYANGQFLLAAHLSPEERMEALGELAAYAEAERLLAELDAHKTKAPAEGDELIEGDVPTEGDVQVTYDGQTKTTAPTADDVLIRNAEATKAVDELGEGAEELAEAFAEAELHGEASLQDAHLEASGEVLGMAACGEVAMSFLGASGSVSAYGKAKGEHGEENEHEVSVGVSAEGEAHVFTEKVSGSWGAATGSAEAKVLSGAVTGEIGASFDPTTGEFKVGAKAEVEGSVLDVHGDVRVGEDDYNVHASVEGKVLTGSAGVGLTFTNDGFDATAGAEAYLATGEAVGGFTFMGITVDAIGEVKVGGAGVKVGAQKEKESFVIDLNGGLGVGLGTKIKVDWSGFPAAWDKAMDNLDAWWNKSASDLYWALHPGGGGSHRF